MYSIANQYNLIFFTNLFQLLENLTVIFMNKKNVTYYYVVFLIYILYFDKIIEFFRYQIFIQWHFKQAKSIFFVHQVGGRRSRAERKWAVSKIPRAGQQLLL